MCLKAQHSAAAKAALGAALKLAQEARNAAKEAESVAMAKQYHAAHISSEYINLRQESTYTVP
jgi:hypothetical protein